LEQRKLLELGGATREGEREVVKLLMVSGGAREALL
jgi:hypothetical protein